MCASVGLNYRNQSVMHGMENVKKNQQQQQYINSFVKSRKFTLVS